MAQRGPRDPQRQAHDRVRLTPQQTQLLCILRNGPVGMGELGRLLHLGKSSLTGLIDRVERHGLVIRVPDEDDRRALKAAVTGDWTVPRRAGPVRARAGLCGPHPGPAARGGPAHHGSPARFHATGPVSG
ncbi:MAG: MarR family transcriptional regulator [Actinobacteria bacterium]|nr:MarR family transcriptional regulator [Actinomycetota bacterium]